MSQRRAFVLVNLALLGTCGFFVYYLATAQYIRPREIDEAREKLNEIEEITVNPPLPEAQQSPVPEGANCFMCPVVTLTPQPTETPRPSPTPIPLKLAIQTWTIASLDAGEVQITDTRNGESFTLALNVPHQAVMDGSLTLQVTLCKVDLDNATATFCANGQEETKSF